MKKIISLIMTAVLCLSLVACADVTITHTDSSSQNTDNEPKKEYVVSIHFKINPEFVVLLDSNNFVVGVEYLNDDARNLFYDTDIVGMKGTDAISTLLTVVFNSDIVKEDISVYITADYHKENTVASLLVNEIPQLIGDIKDKTNIQYHISVEVTDSNAQNTAGKDSVDNIQDSATGTITDSPSMPQSKPYKQNILYRADFDIPDVHSTGYTNMIDYYNAYPDGKDGGTFANASLMVHYRTDMDHDLSQADSIAFRTYRGIGLGSTKADVFSAYGETTIEPPFHEIMGIGDGQHTVSSFADYRRRTGSGACVGIRFYFDQNDTVMFIDYNAVYLKYTGNMNVSNLFPLAS